MKFESELNTGHLGWPWKVSMGKVKKLLNICPIYKGYLKPYFFFVLNFWKLIIIELSPLHKILHCRFIYVLGVGKERRNYCQERSDACRKKWTGN